MTTHHPNLISHIVILVGLAIAVHFVTENQNVGPEIVLGIRFLLLAASVAFVFKCIVVLPRLYAHLRAHRTTGLKGSARWATRKEIRRASTSIKNGYLVGMTGKTPVWLPIESSGLVLSPAGGGKTRDFVIPALMSNSTSMIVADLKGTLAAITHCHRKKKFGHKIFMLNPAGRFANVLGPGACFNPLQLLEDNWVDPRLHKFLMSDAQSLAKQLLPEPVKQGENTFFRNGSRKLLVFAMIYLVMTTGKVTLSRILTLLSDLNTLSDALYASATDERLSGDLARMANDILGKMHDGRPEQLESFREGAPCKYSNHTHPAAFLPQQRKALTLILLTSGTAKSQSTSSVTQPRWKLLPVGLAW